MNPLDFVRFMFYHGWRENVRALCVGLFENVNLISLLPGPPGAGRAAARLNSRKVTPSF